MGVLSLVCLGLMGLEWFTLVAGRPERLGSGLWFLQTKGLGLGTFFLFVAGAFWITWASARRAMHAGDRVTRLKEANTELQANNQAFRAALESSTLVSITDAAGRIIDVNRQFCVLSGYSREELIGENHSILNSGTHTKKFWRDMWRTVHAGKVWRGEVCNRTKDGSLYWVDSNIVAQRDSEGRVKKIFSIRLDITERKRVENELAKTQFFLAYELDRFRRAVRGANDGLWDWIVPDGDVWYSEQFKALLGVAPEDYDKFPSTFDAFVARLHPDDINSVMAAVGTQFRGVNTYDIEYRLRREDGDYRWFRARGDVSFNKDGNVVAMSGSLTDIQERHEFEARLAAKHQELQTIIDAIPGMVLYKDDQNRVIDLNLAAAKFLGGDREKLKAKALEEILPLYRAQAERQVDMDILQSGESRLGVMSTFTGADGEKKYFRTDKIPLKGAFGSVDRLVEVTTDVTALEHANARVRETEERLRLATRSARIGLWDWSIPENSIYFNETYYTMLGYSPGEFPMCIDDWKSRVHPADLDAAMDRIRSHFKGETEVYSSEHRLRCKNGEYLWIRDVGEVVERDNTGTPIRMTGVHIEIQDLRDAIERANHSNQAKSNFLANMSHEIRTPMTAILGYADLIGDGAFSEDSDDMKTAVRAILSNGHHLLTIMNDILDVSKIEAGQMNIEHISFELVSFVDDVVSLVRPRAHKKELELSARYCTRIPTKIVSDPTRLRQIILNLVGNAIKFTLSGRVTLEVSCDPPAEKMIFSVIDTGVGMTEEQCKEIGRFEAFQQADTSTVRRFGGTGLGLKISHTLATLLGGELTFRSKEGEGSTFTASVSTGSLASAVWRDVEREGIRSTSPPLSIDQRRTDTLQGLRILVAEDNLVNQRLVRYILERLGASVKICDNGRIAVEAIETMETSAVPHVILMDMQMPELDGLSATRRLRAQGIQIPILALTANAMDSDRARCFEAGCNDYLSKPIDRSKLIEACLHWGWS